ncbi:MAG: hypothetical protein E7255_15430 [Lachnospiraceae bacterium]|jgi:ABC-type Na+ efflux pump permease subunit|nr:hypothetical protein [Lachnospiraceae bacterium]
MKQSGYVFRMQLSQFKREKGMLIFYAICIILIGILVPFFLHSITTSLIMAAFLTIMFLKPMLSDSMAGERERKTLESLLATPIDGKSIISGKAIFCLMFAVCFFSANTLCITLTNWLSDSGSDLAAWQWMSILIFAICNFSAISLIGVYLSALSGDLRTANSKVALAVYPFGLLFLVFLSVVFLNDVIIAVITGVALILICFGAIMATAIKLSKMKQSDYFENVKIKKTGKAHEGRSTGITPKSQFAIVFRHELKYLLTLKMLLINFAILCIAPAIFACMFPGKNTLNAAVLITALMMPRVPANLIAYSIGGEKVYKTGESLLSTPLHIRPLFLAKCMVPIFVSVIMLLLSSVLTLVVTNISGILLSGTETAYRYTIEQLILLFPVSIMSSITMVLLSGILSVTMKTSRQGLYAASIIGMFFVAPVAAILYLPQNTLLWSAIYLAVLFICNVICVKSISDNISRPQLMRRF